MIKPIFEYDSTVLGDKKNSVQMDLLPVLQNRAAKTFLGRDLHSSAIQALRELNWMPLAKKNTIDHCIFVYKCLNNLIVSHDFGFYSLSQVILIIQETKTILVFKAVE
jgi:hypothetical protein